MTTAGESGRPGTAAPPHATADPLREHGDTQVPAGCLDLSVNVLDGPPAWLRRRLERAVADLAGYPDPRGATAAAAARHGRPPREVLVLNGAVEGLWLLPQALRPRLAACVHPSFTETEAAFRAAGIPVQRVLREPSTWTLDPDQVPASADLVVLARPENPTGAVDPPEVVERLCRPGRATVVDEAFADFLPDGQGLAGRRDLPGLVVLRSLTKLWGLAGLRVGYLLADPDLVARLHAARQPWSTNTLALEAVSACAQAETERRERAERVATARRQLLTALRSTPRVTTWDSDANFVLLRTPRSDLRERLLEAGLAVRRGETFPGLDRHYIRVTVRDHVVTRHLAAALHRLLDPGAVERQR